MINVRPDHECTEDGRFAYYITYIGDHRHQRAQTTGWVVVLSDRKIRNAQDIMYLNNLLVEHTEEGGILDHIKNPVLLSFMQIEVIPEENNNE